VPESTGTSTLEREVLRASEYRIVLPVTMRALLKF